jgi:very-short-patch-repair endonuclease
MFYSRVDKIRSPLEERFLEDCVSVGLIVEPNYKVGPIHADFAIPEKKIAIEIDSKQYHSSPESILEDERRDDIYNSYGWGVIRIKSVGVLKDGEEIVWDIKKGKYDGLKRVVVISAIKN